MVGDGDFGWDRRPKGKDSMGEAELAIVVWSVIGRESWGVYLVVTLILKGNKCDKQKKHKRMAGPTTGVFLARWSKKAAVQKLHKRALLASWP